jgi:hypothetical protein
VAGNTIDSSPDPQRPDLLSRPWAREAITFGAMAAGFVAIDRATRVLANVSDADVARPVLFLRALGAHPAVFAIAGTVGAAAVLMRPRLRVGWDGFDHGRTLRWLALPMVVLLTWSGSMYGFNFLAEQWHWFDRLLVVVLALAVWRWPLALVPFIAQVRIVTHQFDHGFATTAGQNIDEMLVMALVCIAAVIIVGVLIGIDDTSWVVFMLMALIASHFFLPGRSKLPLHWATTDDLSHFPISAYTAGWRGAGDGTWARRASDFAEAFSVPLRVGALVLEVGAVVAAAHVRLFRWWVPGWVLFHLTVLAFTGFWFGSWIAVEVGLLVVLLAPSLREWSTRHSGAATAVCTVGLVLLGAHVFQPPRLAWLDGPVSYGLEVSATGESGTVYRVPASAFAPLDQEIAFVRLQLAGTREAAAAYGAISTTEEYDALSKLGSIDDLADYEQSLGPTNAAPGSTAEHFFTSWLDHANRGTIDPWFLIGPLPHFRSSAPEPVYDGQEHLVSMTVIRVAALDLGDRVEFRRERVLGVELDTDGAAVVVDRWDD